jgi:hypothetical protein
MDSDVVIGHREQIKDEDGTAFADRLYRILTTSQVSLADAARSAAAELVQQEVVVRLVDRHADRAAGGPFGRAVDRLTALCRGRWGGDAGPGVRPAGLRAYAGLG